MRDQQIPLAIDKQGKLIEFTSRLWSAIEQPWAGLAVEEHRIGPTGSLSDFGVKNPLVGLCIGGKAEITIGCGSRAKRVMSKPGRIIILGPGYEQETISWSGVRKTLYVDVEAQKLAHLLPEHDDLAAGPIEPKFGVVDPQLASLMLGMQREIKAGCPGGRLYSEYLSLAFLTYLSARYASRKPPDRRLSYRLSALQVRRVCEYISENISRNLALAELARITGLSPHYFSYLFKNTVGITPHQYVMRERIRVSRRLLASRAASISEIALDVGFANQSHFTEAFRKVTGMTPRKYQHSRTAVLIPGKCD